MASMSLARWAPRLRSALKSTASGIVVVLLLIGGFWGGHLLSPDHSSDEPEGAPTDAALGSVVELTEQKRIAAGIHASPVERREICATKTVAGTIEYISSRHLSLHVPVDCVVGELLVKTGQTVVEGERLATLSSAEIALARVEIEKSEADVRIAQIQHEITKEKHDNLLELLATLDKTPPLEDVEAQFDDTALGDYRQALLGAYSQFVLATNIADRLKPLDKQGLVPGRTVEERASQREVAAARFRTACEKARYESRQELAKAEAAYDIAQRQLAVSQERLRLLLGPFAEEADGEASSEFVVRAPFAGRIEGFTVSPASRVDKGEPLLVLADTSRLWVSALVHQHDWGALKLAEDQTVQVSVPALPGETFEARVKYVGAEVSSTTRALPLVAELDNTAGRFRPGMFAWVVLPMETPRQGLAVSPGAIERQDAEQFVFVEEAKDRYRRVNVKTGLETPDYVEILAGLSTGQMVVDEGAFYLKSELLLEDEE